MVTYWPMGTESFKANSFASCFSLPCERFFRVPKTKYCLVLVHRYFSNVLTYLEYELNYRYLVQVRGRYGKLRTSSVCGEFLMYVWCTDLAVYLPNIMQIQVVRSFAKFAYRYSFFKSTRDCHFFKI